MQAWRARGGRWHSRRVGGCGVQPSRTAARTRRVGAERSGAHGRNGSGGLGRGTAGHARDALLPSGWSMSVWARIPHARLAIWAPDATLLVSVPAEGRVSRLVPGPAGPTVSTLLEGPNQPHGLAFAGDTLYVAEADQIVGYTYADGRAADRRVLAAGLPDARSPELGGPMHMP